MFMLVWALVFMSYGPYVLWLPNETVLSWMCVAVFHVLLLLLLASYVMTVFTDPGTTPLWWHRMVSADPHMRDSHRYCERTGRYRPLRSHYCRMTGRVVLNMDHFCPWVVNTVGFYNRKFFVLFLLYTQLTVTWVLLTSLPTLLRLRQPGQLRLLERQIGQQKYMLACMGVVLDCALLCMLSCFCPFHIRMAMKNETTIEGPSPEFDVGMLQNVRSVFGSDPRLWLLPVWGGGPEGDGLHWPSGEMPSMRELEQSARHYSLEEGRLLARGGADSSDLSDD